MRLATSTTSEGATDPWYGHPNEQEILPRMRKPSCFAAFATGIKRSTDSSMLQLIFLFAKASEAAEKMTISSALASSAA